MMIPMPEIDVSKYDTDVDPFLAVAKLRIRELERKRQNEINIRATIDAQIADFDQQIAELKQDVQVYEDTGKRSPRLKPDDDKIVKKEAKTIGNKVRLEANKRLVPAVEQSVEAPDGWGKRSQINAEGHVVVTLTSPTPVCPSDAKITFEVREAVKVLRDEQAERFCPEDLLREDTEDLPPWEIDRQAELRKIVKQRPSTPQGP